MIGFQTVLRAAGEIETSQQNVKNWFQLAEGDPGAQLLAEVAALIYFYLFSFKFCIYLCSKDRLCGLVVRVLGYRSGGPGSIPGTTRKKVVDLERGPLSLVSATEELLDTKVAAPV
jgi:hypothetical protein